jgi:predicted DNA-binding protein (MmcQ/YjbR family)
MYVISLSTKIMDIETYRNYCLRKKGVTEEFPFDKSTLVYKVMGKMFALTNIDTFESMHLKCDPAIALQLRELHEGITPGYHMNKRHWNTVSMDGSIPDKMIYRWIDTSYGLVVAKLSQKDRKSLEQRAQ